MPVLRMKKISSLAFFNPSIGKTHTSAITKRFTIIKELIFSCMVAVILLIAFQSCNSVDPPPPNGEKPVLELAFEDVSCIEAWIKLTTTNLQLPATISLKQYNPNGDSISQILNLNTKDSLLYIDSLLPNTNYIFKATIQSSSHTSNKLNVTTMDTTSHNFTFEIFTFGTIGSSTLYDVAIINENNIWAVGEINIADTSQNGYTTYNAIHWDGANWNLHRVMFQTICGQPNQSSYPASSIFAFNENDIWIAMDGDQVARLNDTTQLTNYCLPVSFSVKKLWGENSNSMYAVGTSGNIVFFNGSQWTRLESGTDLNINDIWGDYNDKTGEWEILAVGGNILQGTEYERIILGIIGNQVQQLYVEGTSWPLRTVWFQSSKKYYVAGSGIYEKHFIIDTYWENDVYDITTYSINKLRGYFLNDVAATGGVGELIHFNGNDWKSYIDETRLPSGNYYGIDNKNNVLIAVGQNSPQAVVTIGIRVN